MTRYPLVMRVHGVSKLAFPRTEGTFLQVTKLSSDVQVAGYIS
jgi:hypothetical protein